MATVDYGTVSFEGTTYTLKNQAEFTGRVLLEWQQEEGFEEFSAPAVDAKGNEGTVYWVLNVRDDNGETLEDLDGLDWDDVDRVIVSGK
ncbi:hypothetical protein NSS79_25595 [Paenibacillus sp. FSL L8-0436]|uniref:hypothetical protein n=1 Tax=Paenibacillus sp. FSL L8-0436 TaxID=2954686 RepID=UPI0031591D10